MSLRAPIIFYLAFSLFGWLAASDFSGTDTNALTNLAPLMSLTNEDPSRLERPGALLPPVKNSDSLLERRRDEVGLVTVVETGESRRTNRENRGVSNKISAPSLFEDRISERRSLPLVAPARVPLSEASGKNFHFQIGNLFQIESFFDLHRVHGPLSYGVRLDLENREGVTTNQVAVSNSDLVAFRLAFETKAKLKNWELGLDASYAVKRQGLFDWMSPLATEKVLSRNLLLRPSLDWQLKKLRLRLVSENDLTAATAGSSFGMDFFRTENRLSAGYGFSEINFGRAEIFYEYLRSGETVTNLERHRGGLQGEWDFEFFQALFFQAGVGVSGIWRPATSNTFFFNPKFSVSLKKWRTLRFTAGIEGYDEAPFSGPGFLNEPFLFPGVARETDRGYLVSLEGRGVWDDVFQFKARTFLDWAFERNGLQVTTNQLRQFGAKGGALLPGASLHLKLDVKNILLAFFEIRYTALTVPVSFLPVLELKTGFSVQVAETGTRFRVEDRLRVGEQVERSGGVFQTLADRNLLGIRLEQAIGKKIVVSLAVRNLLDITDEWTPGVREFGRTFHLGTELEF